MAKKCIKCELSIPNRIDIDGISKRLYYRKYCLTCSPYKSHNTRKLHLPLKNTSYTIIDKKYWEKNKTNKLLYRKKMKLEYIQLLGGKCVVCGYNKCPEVLTFHHTNPLNKLFPISGSHSRSKEAVLNEVKKCVLLCQNCHGELHSGVLISVR